MAKMSRPGELLGPDSPDPSNYAEPGSPENPRSHNYVKGSDQDYYLDEDDECCKRPVVEYRYQCQVEHSGVFYDVYYNTQDPSDFKVYKSRRFFSHLAKLSQRS